MRDFISADRKDPQFHSFTHKSCLVFPLLSMLSVQRNLRLNVEKDKIMFNYI